MYLKSLRRRREKIYIGKRTIRWLIILLILQDELLILQDEELILQDEEDDEPPYSTFSYVNFFAPPAKRF